MKRIQKILLICLLALFAGTAYSQKKARDNRSDKYTKEQPARTYPEDLEDEEDEADDEDASATKEADLQASIASAKLTESFDIRDLKKRKELQKACRKYYRARALLRKQYPDSTSREYIKRFRILDRAYSKELQKVLPQA